MISDSPRFTVITVVRDALTELKLSRDSVIAQDFDDYEHLVVDGASRDGTMEWLQNQADLRLRWVSEPDGGIYPAMNKAADLARGEYLVFLNAGDCFRTTDVLRRWDSSIHDTGCRWQYARAVVVDAQRRPVRPDYGLRSYSTFAHAYARVALCHQAVAMRKDFFFELGEFDTAHNNVADYALLLRAGRAAAPVVLPSVDIDYLDGGVSAANTRSQQEKHLARVDVLGYGPVRRRIDAMFAYAQQLEVGIRRRAKRMLMRGPASGRIYRRAAKRLNDPSALG